MLRKLMDAQMRRDRDVLRKCVESAVLGITQGASLEVLLEDEAAKEVERVDPDHFDEVDPHGPEWYGLDQSDCF